MPNKKVYGALGLARRAGKCMAGDFACERLIKSGQAQLVIVDRFASEATRSKYRTLCEKQSVQYLEIPEVGSSIGKPGGKIAVILDQSFADMILKAVKNNIQSGS